MTTDVAEKPAAVAEIVKAETPALATEALDAERGDAPTQPAETPDSDTASSTEDEGARLERAARDAEIDRLAEEKAATIVANARAKEAESERAKAVKTRQAEIKTATSGFGPAIAELDAALVKAGVVDEDERKDILKPLHGHNGKLTPLIERFQENAETDVSNRVADWAIEQTPEGESRAAIQKMVDGDASLTDVLGALLEAKALGSDAVKKAKPEDLIEANKALKAHIAAEKDTAYKAGRKKPAVDGEPDTSGSPTNTSEPRSLLEAQEMHAGMHASGRKISNAEMRSYAARFKGRS